MEILRDNLLTLKTDIHEYKKKMLSKKEKDFKISSSRTKIHRKLNKNQKALSLRHYKKSTNHLNFRPERGQREMMILFQNKKEQEFRTNDELINLSKRIEKKSKKETLMSLINSIEEVDPTLPYSLKKVQVHSSMKILKELQK